MSAPENLAFLIREANEVYREKAKDHLTSHQLADFRKCPRLYHRKKVGLIPDEDRPAYLIGRAAHTLILEGQEAFDRRYAVGGPINPRTGRPFGSATQNFAQWASEQAAQGRQCLTEEQVALVVNMARAVRDHPLAHRLLADGIPEGTVRAEYEGKACQGRLDFWNPQRGLIDVKTVDSLDWFCADAKRFGYLFQLGFYQSLVGLKLDCAAKEIPAHFIAVEKHEPFRAGLWQVSQEALAYARRENEAAVVRLLMCEHDDRWPTGFEETILFDTI